MDGNRREMLLTSLATLGALIVPQVALADTTNGPAKPSPTDANPLLGKWIYRSFVSNPDMAATPEKLIFGIGRLTVEPSELDQFNGRLAFDADVLQLRGTVSFANVITVRFQGVGIEGDAKSDNWVYDYLGFLAPSWPNGVAQRPAIIGTIVRTLPHSEGKARAGVVNCWIAVKQDSKAP
jgi:hypothetical protein